MNSDKRQDISRHDGVSAYFLRIIHWNLGNLKRTMNYSIFIGREILANFLMGFIPIRVWRIRRGRTNVGDISDKVKLILDQFRLFTDTVGWNRLKGKTIAEIGPGDAIPHGLLFLGAGAKEYVAIDRFLGDIDGPSARVLYQALAESAPTKVKEGWAAQGLDPSRFPWFEPNQGLPSVRLYPDSIETADPGDVGQIDIIFSYNVVEHLSDISFAFKNMTRMLGPDGMMVHRVDYSPHDCWKNFQNPLTFLTIPKSLWSLLGSNRGYPNRYRHSRVMSALSACGLESRTRITGWFPVGDVEKIRRSLPQEFRILSNEDLRIADAVVVAMKTSPFRYAD